MAIRQPASRNDVWFLHGRVAGRFEGLDAARASRGPQNRRGSGSGEPARGALSGGVSRGPQRWPRYLGERYGGGGGKGWRPPVGWRDTPRYHAAQPKTKE